MKDRANEAYLLPPQVLALPRASHALATRRFQGIPSVAVAQGVVWATWYAGPTPDEDQNNYVVLAASVDDGATWVERLAIDPDVEGPVRAFDPQLWLDPTGRLWSFWAQAIGHDGTIAGVWSMTCDEPGRIEAAWSAPRRLTDGVMMGKPLVLSSGEWMLPASTWRQTDGSARAVVSTDAGRSWQVRGACDVPRDARCYDEHMIVERRDGSLWMLVRTTYGIGESVSADRGRSWSAMKPSALAHPSARFFVRRLGSGNLLLVKHGPLREQTGRSHLTAYVSGDDGATWSGGLLLDEREGVSYPDGDEDGQGLIHVVYDRSRRGDREILLARFTEAAAASGGAAASRTVVSRHPDAGR